MDHHLRRLSHALGAEVVDFTIERTLDADTVASIRQAFLDSQILLFRNQRLDHDTHIAFSRHFGPLDPHDSVPDYRSKTHPEILEVTNAGRAKSQVFGRQWHSDHSMTVTPSLASLLRAEELPEIGGETSFANMYLAFQSLSPTLQRTLRTLKAVHTVSTAHHLRGADPETIAAKEKRNPPVVHDVVRRHPETGREALYVNEMMTSHFYGMTVEESRPMLEFLFAHSTRPEFTYRHQWRRGDLIIWDNRCTMHLAHADYDHDQMRRLYRTTIIGPEVGVLETGQA